MEKCFNNDRPLSRTRNDSANCKERKSCVNTNALELITMYRGQAFIPKGVKTNGRILALDDVDIVSKFNLASEFLSKNPTFNLTEDQRLRFYGLFQQAQFGDITTTKPALINPAGRSKWEAWKQYQGMPSPQAMEVYVSLVTGLCPGWLDAEFSEARTGVLESQKEDADDEDEEVIKRANKKNGTIALTTDLPGSVHCKVDINGAQSPAQGILQSRSKNGASREGSAHSYGRLLETNNAWKPPDPNSFDLDNTDHICDTFPS